MNNFSDINIRPMVIDDYHRLINLFEVTPGISLREADDFESTKRYLIRNKNLSFVAELDSQIIGCVMCGHDGRRGYLQHLIIIPKYRKQGIAKKLVNSSLEALSKIGIYKTHLFVMKSNQSGINFWDSQNWERRDDILTYSFTNSSNKNV